MESTTNDVAQDLADIKAEIMQLLDQADSVLNGADRATRDRAMSYWFAHIRIALDDDHLFIGGGNSVTMQDTIDDIRGEG